MESKSQQRLQQEINRYQQIKRLRLIQKARRKTFANDLSIRSRFSTSQTDTTTHAAATSSSSAPAGTTPPSNGPSKNPSTGASSTAVGQISNMLTQSAVTAYHDTSIAQVAILMAAHHVDVVLIVDRQECTLSGIVTDRDILRSVGSLPSDSLSSLACSQIMTHNPTFVRQTQSLDDALQLMINGRFRHLPVADEADNIIGMLDILQVLQHVLSKLRNSWGKAKALLVCWRDFQTSWQNIKPPRSVQRWFEQWQHSIPTLGQFVSETSTADALERQALPYPHVLSGDNVKQAVQEMVRFGTRAVIVLDNAMELVGIFTSKDLVLRVIANGQDIDTCTIIRVMTPYPDFTSAETHVDEALQRMYDNNYQHIPVLKSLPSHDDSAPRKTPTLSRKRSQTIAVSGESLDSASESLPDLNLLENVKSTDIVALCDVLALTCHTLEQLMKQQSIEQIYFSLDPSPPDDIGDDVSDLELDENSPLQDSGRVKVSNTSSITTVVVALFCLATFLRFTRP